MTSSKASLVSSLALLSALMSGCYSSSSSRLPVYDRTQIGQVINEQKGEVIAVRDVVIKAPNSQVGSAGVGSRIGAGAVASAVTGSPMGAASAIGSVLGGVVGSRADDRIGEELTIQIEGGRSIMVVQERGSVPYVIGDRVKVQTGGSSNTGYGGSATMTQVVHDDSLQYAELSRPTPLTKL